MAWARITRKNEIDEIFTFREAFPYVNSKQSNQKQSAHEIASSSSKRNGALRLTLTPKRVKRGSRIPNQAPTSSFCVPSKYINTHLMIGSSDAMYGSIQLDPRHSLGKTHEAPESCRQPFKAPFARVTFA
jgi:hypothetical protein